MSSTPRFLLGALLLFPLALLAQGKKRPDLPLEMSRLPAVPTMPDAFPQVIGTQVFGPAYKFTKDEAVLEAAKGISAMGSRILKINAVSGQQLTPYIAMPFTHYVLWYRSSNEWTKGFTPELKRREYNAVYHFTKDLLTRYDTAGKTFFLGHWEGDWYLLPDKDVKKDASPELIAAMIEWFSIRQKAVDDARSEVSYAKCRVYTYAEVNRVRDAMKDGRQRMVNVEGAFMRRMSSSAFKVWQARSSAANPSRTPGNNRRAASVSCKARPLRWNRRQAKCSSSVRICRLTALWVIDSSSAARVNDVCRAAASNARRAYKGGRRRDIRKAPIAGCGQLSRICPG